MAVWRRPSPEWKKQGEDLQAAKDAAARNRKGQQEQAEHRKQEEEKFRLLQEVADTFRADSKRLNKTSPETCATRSAVE